MCHTTRELISLGILYTLSFNGLLWYTSEYCHRINEYDKNDCSAKSKITLGQWDEKCIEYTYHCQS